MEIYLLTCSPGKEIETIHGHSAIRIIDHLNRTDSVYNWGVYDFEDPYFILKFIKGRLVYHVTGYTFNNFREIYRFEERDVISQRINLEDPEKQMLSSFIQDNLQPENKYYLYDFYHDNCATRIRDLLEKTLGGTLVYPVVGDRDDPTFRELADQAQSACPWLTFGTDLLVGMLGDNRAGFREQMFLPEYLKKNLSVASVNRNNSFVPLLAGPEMILNFGQGRNQNHITIPPVYLFSLCLILAVLIPVYLHNDRLNLWLDGLIFFIFSILALIMFYLGFISDHLVSKMNLNLLWLNPFIILAFISLFNPGKKILWFRVVFLVSVLFLFSWPFLPQSMNPAIFPLLLILIVRSYSRSDLLKQA